MSEVTDTITTWTILNCQLIALVPLNTTKVQPYYAIILRSRKKVKKIPLTYPDDE